MYSKICVLKRVRMSNLFQGCDVNLFTDKENTLFKCNSTTNGKIYLRQKFEVTNYTSVSKTLKQPYLSVKSMKLI